jgi:sugar phosphate permease
MGVWATNFQAGGVAANALAAWALGAWGYQYAFFTGSVVLFVLWGFFIFNQRNRPEDVGLKPVEDPAPAEGQSAAPVADGAAWPRAVIINLALVSAFYFFLKSIRYAIWSWAPYLLQTHHKLSGADAGFASTAFDVAGIVGVIAIGFASDRLFAGRRAMVSFLFVLGLVGSCAMLYLAGPVSVTLFTISITLVGFTLYGPDALMSGAGAIDVGSRDRAVLAAGVINGAGSVGTVIQELVLGKLLAKDDLGSALALLFVSATAAAGCLGLILLRNRRGSADL